MITLPRAASGTLPPFDIASVRRMDVVPPRAGSSNRRGQGRRGYPRQSASRKLERVEDLERGSLSLRSLLRPRAAIPTPFEPAACQRGIPFRYVDASEGSQPLREASQKPPFWEQRLHRLCTSLSLFTAGQISKRLCAIARVAGHLWAAADPPVATALRHLLLNC